MTMTVRIFLWMQRALADRYCFLGMDIKGGHEAVKKMKEAGNNQGKVVEIPHAGVS